MWSMIDSIATQVTNYSSGLGKFWYILVFGYRLVVITSLGGSVYGDEQGAFECSVKEVGCENMCYNNFAKISHMRFWAFQLIAISTPTIMFHFYSLHVKSQVEKIKRTEEAMKSLEENGDTIANHPSYDYKMEKDMRKLQPRKNNIGKFKVKEVYREGEKKEIVQTNKIKVAFIVSLIIRLAVEILFTYFGYSLFNIQQQKDGYGESGDGSLFLFLWMKVPGNYWCKELDIEKPTELTTACAQHLKDNKHGHVPCWVSRPYEKTVFLRYMNIVSFICMIITLLEVFNFIWRQANSNMKSKKMKLSRLPMQESHSHHQWAPPSFETVMRKGGVMKNRSSNMYELMPGGYKPIHKVNTIENPPQLSFESISIEDVEKPRGKERKPRRKNSPQDDAPPYESDRSYASRGSRKR